MQKDWEAFQADFRKQKAKFKPVKASDAEKLRKALIDALKQAWDAEDTLCETIAAAAKAGIKGAKPEDFQKDKGFARALDAWKKQSAVHKTQLKALEAYCKNADKLYLDWKKRHDAIEKSVKKSKEAPAAKKEITATIKESATALEDVKTAAEVFSKLKVAEVFYAANEKRTIETLLKKEAKKAAPKEMPKILEPAEGKKNQKVATTMLKKVKDLCKSAQDLAAEAPKKALGDLKKAQKQFEALADIHNGYQAAEKKQKKEIAASEAKADILRVIKAVQQAHKEAQTHLKQAEDQIGKAPA
jgi:ATP-dependent Lon protease